MDQFRLVLGLGLMTTQLGIAALMVGLFLKARGEHASRYWASGSFASLLAMLISGFLPLGRPSLWQFYLSAFLVVASLWLVWRGFRSYREMPTPRWGWLVPGLLFAAFVCLLFTPAPQLVRSVFFTLSACSVLVMIAAEAVSTRSSKARWLVLAAVLTNALSYMARPVLYALGYGVSGDTTSLPGLAVTYLVPILDYFLLYTGLALLALQKIIRQKDALAALDELTQLPNRRAFIEAARREVRASCRNGSPFTLMLVDVDHFKNVNDSLGHVAGDAVLRELGRVLVSACRPTDLVSRYGGDEFVILCPGLASEPARGLAQRLIEAIRTGMAGGSVTVSVGLAAFEGCDETASWVPVFERADRALYSAKEAGRNRLVVG